MSNKQEIVYTAEQHVQFEIITEGAEMFRRAFNEGLIDQKLYNHTLSLCNVIDYLNRESNMPEGLEELKPLWQRFEIWLEMIRELRLDSNKPE